jgi:protein phosphatase 2C family protein 2/3
LHQFIVRDTEFPHNPRAAIFNGFWKSEQYFLDTVERFSAGRHNMLDRSGSCAIVTLFVDDVCFTANLGDSRAVMSCNGGQFLINLSEDQKPSELKEQ